jgi:hypothetical protein
VAGLDAQGSEGDFEGDAATATGDAGEHRTVEFLPGVKRGWVS